MVTRELALVAFVCGLACSSSTQGGGGHAAGAGGTGGGGADGFVGLGGGGLADCGALGGGAPPATCDPLAPRRTFDVDVAPLLVGCVGESCHSGMPYARLVGFPSVECSARVVVAPGDPSASYLVDKLKGERMCCGARMPLNKEPLAPDTIKRIEDWICQGAPEQ